jgi:hypothetical protein
MKKIYFIAVALVMTSSILFSQTIEDKLLKKKEQRILNYYYQAKTGGRNQKVNVLESILSEYDESRYSEKDQKLVDLVVYLSQEGSTRQEFESNRLVNDFPEVRREACMVLAKIGGDQARSALIDILANDASATVKAEALESLAIVKDNQKNEALRAIVFMYRSSYKPDPKLITGLINAIVSIAKGNAEVYGDAILILSEIQVGQFPRTTREMAFNAIKKLNAGE